VQDAWSSSGGGGRVGSASLSDTASRSEHFRPAHRIRKRKEFQTVYERGRRVSGRAFVVFLLPNELGHPRLGITAPKRVGSAVIRNRMKRIVREIFRRNRDCFGTHDVVVNVRSLAPSLSFPAMKRDLLRSARRGSGAGRER
jgi:ribonuclease P protein component